MHEQENKTGLSTGKNPGGSSINQENCTSTAVEKIGMPEDGKNKGGSPVDINDGGKEGEAKQPTEHTGRITSMGGDTRLLPSNTQWQLRKQ